MVAVDDLDRLVNRRSRGASPAGPGRSPVGGGSRLRMRTSAPRSMSSGITCRPSAPVPPVTKVGRGVVLMSCGSSISANSIRR